MKKIIISALAYLLLLSSCNLNSDFSRIENIKKGSKWTLKIGSTPAEVYSQLQELNKKKKIGGVEIVGRKDLKPEDFRDKIGLYDYLYFEYPTADNGNWRTRIQFNDGKVECISVYGIHQTAISEKEKWPENLPDETAILINDPIGKIPDKLAAIFQTDGYQDPKIQMYRKTLSLPFDPDMGNYERWNFVFFEDILPGKNSRSTVELIFKNGKLYTIKHTYEEFYYQN